MYNKYKPYGSVGITNKYNNKYTQYKYKPYGSIDVNTQQYRRIHVQTYQYMQIQSHINSFHWSVLVGIVFVVYKHLLITGIRKPEWSFDADHQ